MVPEKAAAIVISVAVIAFALWLGALAGAVGSGSPINGSEVAAGLVMASLLALGIGAVALLIATHTGNQSASIGVAVSLLLVMYFANALAPAIPSLSRARAERVADRQAVADQVTLEVSVEERRPLERAESATNGDRIVRSPSPRRWQNPETTCR
jgi:hypothetical protein